MSKRILYICGIVTAGLIFFSLLTRSLFHEQPKIKKGTLQSDISRSESTSGLSSPKNHITGHPSSFSFETAQDKTNDDQQKFEEMLVRFNLPEDVKTDIVQAMEDGEEAGPTDENQPQATNAQLAAFKTEPMSEPQQALTSAYTLDDQIANSLLAAARPTPNDTTESKLVKSDALMNAGFSAMSSGNFEQAETAFNEVIQNYTDIEAAKVASLEMAMLLAEQNRIGEAIETIDYAIQDYNDDLAYVQQANTLKQRLLK